MKVKELIDKLAQLDPELVVIVSRDEEGNAFNPLCDVELASYDPDDRRLGIYELDDAARESGYGEEDVKPVKAVCIWP